MRCWRGLRGPPQMTLSTASFGNGSPRNHAVVRITKVFAQGWWPIQGAILALRRLKCLSVHGNLVQAANVMAGQGVEIDSCARGGGFSGHGGSGVGRRGSTLISEAYCGATLIISVLIKYRYPAPIALSPQEPNEQPF